MQYRFDLEHIAFFSSALAAEIRAEYRKQTEKYADPLRIQTALRALWHDLPPALLSACMAQFALQDRAAATLGLPDGALFTRDALEMASSAAVARLHASLLPGDGRLLEIGAGVGADSAALSRRARILLCLEADSIHARLLRHNLSLLPATNASVLRGTAERLLPAILIDRFDAVYADPARRSASADGTRRRGILLEEYSPPFSLFDSLPRSLPVLVKVAPAAEAPADWGVAAVAAAGECKELLLHRNLDLPPRCALDADSGARWTPGPDLPPAPTMPHANVPDGSWLIEPHAAIIRSGGVAQYCREQGCEPLDPRIAYAWSAVMPPGNAWHRRFRLLHAAPYQRKALQHIATRLGFGPSTEIKKRGFPDTPEDVRARLTLTGTRRGVIFLTRRGDSEHLMLFAERV